jgi:MOSC domain-containing protein YiiM
VSEGAQTSVRGGGGGHVTALHVAGTRGGDVSHLDAIEVDRLGIHGDRHRRSRYRRGTAVTLVAEEDVEACAQAIGATLSTADSRRNVATRGVDLAALVGLRFCVGTAVLFGVERCDPCGRLERRTVRGVREQLHGGLRCDVLEAGRIAVGDLVETA